MTEFWLHKSLDELTRAEWEALCDRCGRCCQLKLEDVDTGELFYTNIVCRYLKQDSCQCRYYNRRSEVASECLLLTAANIQQLRAQLPPSCAYRRLAEGKPLPAWHPLLTGRADSVAQAGISVTGKVISEDYIHPEQYEEHIIYWDDDH